MKEERMKTRGRPARSVLPSGLITKAVLQFLQKFMPETLAKRICSLVLIAAGIPNARITELTGISERSIWSLKKAISSSDMESLFAIERGAGRPGKARGVEGEIASEIEKNNYQTRQQVADMIFEKFGISMSVSAVGKLLKKTSSEG